MKLWGTERHNQKEVELSMKTSDQSYKGEARGQLQSSYVFSWTSGWLVHTALGRQSEFVANILKTQRFHIKSQIYGFSWNIKIWGNIKPYSLVKQ